MTRDSDQTIADMTPATTTRTPARITVRTLIVAPPARCGGAPCRPLPGPRRRRLDPPSLAGSRPPLARAAHRQLRRGKEDVLGRRPAERRRQRRRQLAPRDLEPDPRRAGRLEREGLGARVL